MALIEPALPVELVETEAIEFDTLNQHWRRASQLLFSARQKSLSPVATSTSLMRPVAAGCSLVEYANGWPGGPYPGESSVLSKRTIERAPHHHRNRRATREHRYRGLDL